MRKAATTTVIVMLYLIAWVILTILHALLAPVSAFNWLLDAVEEAEGYYE